MFFELEEVIQILECVHLNVFSINFLSGKRIEGLRSLLRHTFLSKICACSQPSYQCWIVGDKGSHKFPKLCGQICARFRR